MADEELAYANQLFRRAEGMRPMHRAAMLPVLFEWSPDVSDLWPGADCSADLALVNERDFFAQRPLAFSRLQIARAIGLGRGWAGRASLMRIADLSDDEIAPYAPEPEESEPPPPRNALRRAALLGMHSGLVMNDAGVRAYVVRTLHRSTDAWEQLALIGGAQVVLTDALWGHPDRIEGPNAEDARALLRERLRHLGERIDGPPDRVELDLAIRWLPKLGYYALRAGNEREVRAIAERIAGARGELPIAQQIEGGAWDLAIAARTAIAYIDHPIDGVWPSEVSPTPAREVFEPREEPWLGVVPWRESAGDPRAEAARAAQLEMLVRDLDTLRSNRPRCHVMNDMLLWATEADARRLFDLVAAPLRTSGTIVPTSELLCRIAIASQIRGPIDPERISLLISLYDLPADRLAAYDGSLDEHGPGIGYEIFSSLRPSVLHALGSRPERIDHSELRAFVPCIEAQALDTRADVDSHEAQAAVAFHPLTEAWLRWSIASMDEGSRAPARALVAQWIASIVERLDAPPTGAVWPWYRTIRWLYTIGTYAPALGLAPEARAMLERARARDRASELLVVFDVVEFMLGMTAPRDPSGAIGNPERRM